MLDRKPPFKERFKNFFSGLGHYAKDHPYWTALYATIAVGGLLIAAAGIVLIVTAPATFGGGAVAGGVLLGVGGGAALGTVVIVGGLATTGTMLGLFASSAKRNEIRRQTKKNLNRVQILQENDKADIPMDVFVAHHTPKPTKPKKGAATEGVTKKEKRALWKRRNTLTRPESETVHRSSTLFDRGNGKSKDSDTNDDRDKEGEGRKRSFS